MFDTLKNLFKKEPPVVQKLESELPMKDVASTVTSSVFGSVTSAIGGFFDTAKIWIFVIMFVLILLLSGGLYFYYNYSQSEISAAISAEQTALNAFNSEKTAFEKQQQQTKNLLDQLATLQTQQTITQQQNDALKKQIESYNFASTGKTNPSKAEKDANTMYNNVLKKLEAATAAVPAGKGK